MVSDYSFFRGAVGVISEISEMTKNELQVRNCTFARSMHA